MKIIVAPDSFKGSLSAGQIATAMADGIRSVIPTAQVVEMPLADGGEGTLETAFALLGGVMEEHLVSGIDGNSVSAPVLWLSDEEALIESANVAGLDQIGSTTVYERSSIGVGELLKQAIAGGAKTIYVALGGTGSNDGGAGVLVSMGARILDASGGVMHPSLHSIMKAKAFDFSGVSMPKDVQIIGLSDVTNPLNGGGGASAVFGPQKGLRGDFEIGMADRGIAAFASAAEMAMGRYVSDAPGAGAAGGIGFACLLLGGRLVSGADWLLDRSGFHGQVREADLVITGEGRSDQQTLSGKLPCRIFAQAQGVPVTLLSGGIARDARADLARVFAGCFSIADGPAPLDDLKRTAYERIFDAAASLASLRYARTVVA